MKSVEYQLFYQFKGRTVWGRHEYTAENDIAAISYAGNWIETEAPKRYHEPISKWGMQKVTTERLI